MNNRLPTFDQSDEDSRPVSLLRLGNEPTETIDFADIDAHLVEESGSFSVDGVSSTSIGKLFHSLPIPVILLDESASITFANQACEKIAKDFESLKGVSIFALFPRTSDVTKTRGIIRDVFLTRKPQVSQGIIQAHGYKIWGRMNFRSLRMAGRRFVFVLIEDLTVEKKQLILMDKHEKELKAAHAELDRRVRERTAELVTSNENLTREIVQRRRAEAGLKDMLRRLEGALNGAIVALSAMAEKRDPFTHGYQRRVAQLACIIGERMKLPEEQVNGIAIAAAVHDIGKVVVPAELLAKPGKLNEHEYGIIKTHAQIGFDILKEIDFPWPLAKTVLQHHERIDGSGYPQGLIGDDILPEARIVAVADVVEAMSSFRPYRHPVGKNKAMEEISRNRGTLYDPKVVEACLWVLERGFRFE
ncbi:MAG: HD domain-containing phosphohydrolase [Pseudomonadota bacterium]